MFFWEYIFIAFCVAGIIFCNWKNYWQRAMFFWARCQSLRAYFTRNRALSNISLFFAVLCGLFVLLFSVWVYPFITALYGIIHDEIKDIELNSKAFRNASLSVAGSITLLIAVLGLVLTVIRSILVREQNRTDEQRLVTEQISRAVDQIGASKQSGKVGKHEPNIEVRLGGLYSLQRIMQDSPKDAESIAKIFCAYIRENAKRDRSGMQKLDAPRGKAFYQVPEDIQAAWSIVRKIYVGEIEESRGFFPYEELNFSRANFANYSLADMDFSDAILHRANFSGADLFNTNFSSAYLFVADLSGARVSGTNFSGAILDSAKLCDVYVLSADFSGASLNNTDLSGANLTNAKGLTKKQINQAFGDERTILPAGLNIRDAFIDGVFHRRDDDEEK